MSAIFAVVVLFMPVGSRAQEVPAWATKAPPTSGGYFFFSGRGEGASILEARAAAEAEARGKAIQRFSGVYASFRQHSNESNDRIELKSEHRLGSDIVQLRNFEEVESFFQNSEHRHEAFLLFRLPQSEAARLERISTRTATSRFNDVSIETIPSGAEVRINGKVFGVSPMRALLPLGVHKLSIQKKGYLAASRTLEIGGRESLSLSIPLETVMASFRVTGAPVDSRAFVNGEPVRFGQTIDLPSGSYRIRVERDGYETFQREGIATHGQLETVHVELRRTPVHSVTLRETEDPEALFKLGRKAIEKRQFVRAQQTIEKLKRMSPKLDGSLLEAELLQATNQYQAAYVSYLTAAKKSGRESRPTTAGNLCWLGGRARIDSRFTDSAAVKEFCERAIGSSPLNAGYHAALGMYFEGEERWMEARNSYRTAASLDRSYKPLLINLCRRQGFYFKSWKQIACL